ncbi:MAG: 2-oxoglutarate oxidoreductase [Deltaproteobacteria bacterium]|nr:2-oxoglutarate oxidoreductase [Deltaproteobacteria bacterium]
MTEAVAFARTPVLTDSYMHYCPGCTHGTAHRLVAEVIDELGIQDRTVGVSPVGCAVLAYNYIDVDFLEAAHGRAPAAATGLRRTLPADRYVFAYQGDGDLASIGMAEILHAANRGEKITVVFINNAIYGMTGGQMAPTTLPGMRTTTSPQGRDSADSGHPIRVCELLDTLVAPVFLARGTLSSAKGVLKAKKLLRRAFELQHQGFTLVELLSTCPTGWGLTPGDSLAWLDRNMTPFFPIRTFREPGAMPPQADPYRPDLRVRDDGPTDEPEE